MNKLNRKIFLVKTYNIILFFLKFLFILFSLSSFIFLTFSLLDSYFQFSKIVLKVILVSFSIFCAICFLFFFFFFVKIFFQKKKKVITEIEKKYSFMGQIIRTYFEYANKESGQLIEDDLEKNLEKVKRKDFLSFNHLRKSFFIFIFSLFSFLIYSFGNFHQTTLNRFSNSFSNEKKTIENKYFKIKNLKFPRKVNKGDNFSIIGEIELNSLKKINKLNFVFIAGDKKRVVSAKIIDNKFNYEIYLIQKDIRFYLQIDDYKTKTHTILVRKKIEKFSSVTLEYPDYLKKKKLTTTNLNISAVEGTKVTWKMDFEYLVSSFLFSLDKNEKKNIRSISFSKALELSNKDYYYKAITKNNEVSNFYELDVFADNPPEIKIKNRKLKDKKIKIFYGEDTYFSVFSKDDFGLRKIVVTMNSIEAEQKEKIKSISIKTGVKKSTGSSKIILLDKSNLNKKKWKNKIFLNFEDYPSLDNVRNIIVKINASDSKGQNTVEQISIQRLTISKNKKQKKQKGNKKEKKSLTDQQYITKLISFMKEIYYEELQLYQNLDEELLEYYSENIYNEKIETQEDIKFDYLNQLKIINTKDFLNFIQNNFNSLSLVFDESLSEIKQKKIKQTKKSLRVITKDIKNIVTILGLAESHKLKINVEFILNNIEIDEKKLPLKNQQINLYNLYFDALVVAGKFTKDKEVMEATERTKESFSLIKVKEHSIVVEKTKKELISLIEILLRKERKRIAKVISQLEKQLKQNQKRKSEQNKEQKQSKNNNKQSKGEKQGQQKQQKKKEFNEKEMKKILASSINEKKTKKNIENKKSKNGRNFSKTELINFLSSLQEDKLNKLLDEDFLKNNESLKKIISLLKKKINNNAFLSKNNSLNNNLKSVVNYFKKLSDQEIE